MLGKVVVCCWFCCCCRVVGFVVFVVAPLIAFSNMSLFCFALLVVLLLLLCVFGVFCCRFGFGV